MIVYRYRPFTPYLEDEIANGAIFYGSTLKMNDFYDGFFRYTREGDLEKYFDIFSKTAVQRAQEILDGKMGSSDQVANLERVSGKDLEQWAWCVLNVPDYLEQSKINLIENFKNHPERVQAAVDVQNKNADLIRDKVFIACFSEKKLDMSMFGYYSSDGKGVMIAYADDNGLTKPINYVDRLPEITIDQSPEEIVNLQIFTKLNDWQHEKERRAYLYAPKDQRSTDHGLIMKRIYLGPRTEKDSAELIKTWAAKRNIPVLTHEMTASGGFTWI